MKRLTLALIVVLGVGPSWADPSARTTPVVGCQLQPVPEALYAHIAKLPAGQGLLIENVTKGSLGERVGLKQHDILLSLGGTTLKDADHFARLLFALADNTSVTLIRKGKETKLPIALKDEDLPKSLAKRAGLPEVTIKAQTLDANKVSLTLIYYPEKASKRVSLTVAGSLKEIEKQVDDLARTKTVPPPVQDVVAEAVKRLRGLNEAQTKKLYVTNSGGDNIHVIDLAALKVIGEIKTPPHPHGAAVSADGKRFFTTVESDHTLLVFDTAGDKLLQRIKLTEKPNQCAVTPDGKFVGVPIRGGDSVDIVDVAQGKIVKNLPVKVPHNCYNAGRNDRLFVTSMGDHKVNLIDLKTLSYAAEIPVGGVPRPLAVTRDEKTLYCALSDLHGFVIADIPSRKVIHRIELPALQPGTKLPVPQTPTHGLELSPDEKELWVTSCGTDTMYVFDTAKRQVVGKVGVGKGPNWVCFSPDGRFCCVSNVLSDDVSILDVAKRREVARVPVGKNPKRLVVAKSSP